jgi:multiple sugar transport system substrate-binding protein
MTSRKVISTVIGVVAAATVLSACGGTASSTGNGPAGHGAVSTIQLYNDKGAEDNYFTEIGQLAKKDIGVGVTPVGYTDENTYTSLIDASFRTNDKPDVFTWHTGSQLQEVAEQNAVVPTTSIWQKDIADGDLTKGVEQYYTVGNQQYCVPLYVSYYTMFYNKQVFAKYHLSPPSTWTGLISIAATLKAHGVTPFYETDVLFSFLWFEQLLIGQNPALYNQLANGTASYTSPGVVAVMKEWKSLIADGYMTNPAVTTQPQTLLKSGAVAMAPFGTWFTGDLATAGATTKDYGMFVIPAQNTSLAKTPMIFESGPLCVPAGASDMNADMKFLQWFTTPAPESNWAQYTGDTGADPKAASGNAEVNAVDEMAASSKAELLNRYYEATPSTILNTALSEFGAFMVNPSSYMQDLQAIQATASQYWSSHRS